jgi:hypothetical protein
MFGGIQSPDCATPLNIAKKSAAIFARQTQNGALDNEQVGPECLRGVVVSYTQMRRKNAKKSMGAS